MTTNRYVTKLARGAPGTNRDYPRVPDVLADCPDGYRLHSMCPIADGGGYTSYVYVIFERESGERRA